VVEARGVVIATILAALIVLGLVAFAASTIMPSTLRDQACQSGQLPDSQCDE
jgi:FlaG/FlaF family flagellin (archaellin)